jgi:hypothetical protein
MSILPLMMISSLIWGVAAGYGIPAFIDWTKEKRKQQIREGLK